MKILFDGLDTTGKYLKIKFVPSGATETISGILENVKKLFPDQAEHILQVGEMLHLPVVLVDSLKKGVAKEFLLSLGLSESEYKNFILDISSSSASAVTPSSALFQSLSLTSSNTSFQFPPLSSNNASFSIK